MFLTNRYGKSAQQLSYDEAARWLVCMQAWDYAGKKASIVGGMPNGGGTGWLGKIGVVYPEGKNLFETLLLNFVLLKDDALLSYAAPVWENKTAPTAAKSEKIPAGYCELLTWQSRRALLHRNHGKVDGVIHSYGDVFAKGNIFDEQMTGWHLFTKKGFAPEFIPNLHRANRSIWRDLGAILPLKINPEEQNLIPGVVKWLSNLNSVDIGHVRIHAVGVEFGTMMAVIDELIDDKVSIDAKIFMELGENWVNRIVGLLATTDECVKRLGDLADNLATASGDSGDKGSGKDGKKTAAMEEAYFRLDNPFRSWLAAIDPQSGDIDLSCDAWREQVRGIVMELAKALIEEAGDNAFLGRVIKIKNKKDLIINSPKASVEFKSGIAKILNK
jgi:CRISPR system Cascade subunit CasA